MDEANIPDYVQEQENVQGEEVANPGNPAIDNAEAEPNDNDENTNLSGGDGAIEMLQEHVYSNDEDGSLERPTNIEVAPEPNIDENTILLPVAGENGFSADDPAITFNASDFLQEEEDVTDPMATSTERLAEKTITQVPKKRRIPEPVKYEEEEDDSPDRRQKRRGRKPGTKVINGLVIYPSDEPVNPIKKSSSRLKHLSITPVLPKSTHKVTPKTFKVGKAKSVSGQVDEHQCRVCTTSADLVGIFKKEYQKTYAEKLMSICPAVSIQKKDFLPQFICKICVSSVNAAYAMKSQCEQTDVELREVLEKSVKKIRKVTNYVPPDSDPDDVPDAPQDQDFKLSDASPPSVDDSDSDFGKPLMKRRTRRGSKKGSTPKIKTEKTEKAEKKIMSPVIKKESPLKKKIKPDPDLNDSKTSEQDGDTTVQSVGVAAADFSSGSEENYSPPKKRRGKGKKTKTPDVINLTCNVCNETLNSREEFREHKKTLHSSFDCELCGRKFKMQSSLKTHMEKHTSLKVLDCEPCNMHFPNKTERRRHMMEVHKDSVAQFSCEKCKRAFTSETRLQKHAETNCPGFDTSQKKRGDLESISMGKDLFKCVAPLTTTYWSDSFSD